MKPLPQHSRRIAAIDVKRLAREPSEGKTPTMNWTTLRHPGAGASSDSVFALARCILKPGNVRLYALDGSNTLSNEWYSLRKAVDSCRTFRR